MFRMWGKIFKNNHLIKDAVICCDDASMSRTSKVYYALEQLSYEFNLEKPFWLENNKNDFILHGRTRFTCDNFIENIDFDYLHFQVIEEDWYE